MAADDRAAILTYLCGFKARVGEPLIKFWDSRGQHKRARSAVEAHERAAFDEVMMINFKAPFFEAAESVFNLRFRKWSAVCTPRATFDFSVKGAMAKAQATGSAFFVTWRVISLVDAFPKRTKSGCPRKAEIYRQPREDR